MYLTHMRPEQIQDAVQRNVPVLMAAGCIEYHGPHLPIGTDFLIANSVCVEAEKRVECVMAPPLSLAPTLAWAAGPEEGEIDFDPEVFFCVRARNDAPNHSDGIPPDLHLATPPGPGRAGGALFETGSYGSGAGNRTQVGRGMGSRSHR